MKQNGVVFKPGPALLLFLFLFEYLISGPKSYRAFEKRAPGHWEAFKQKRTCFILFVHSISPLVFILIEKRVSWNLAKLGGRGP